MNQDQKKPTKKKKTSGIKDKFSEKIKVPGTFNDLMKKAISTPHNKNKK